MARKKRRRAKGLGSVYRRGQVWSIAWVSNGAKLYEHGFPDEDTARRVLTVKIGDVAAGRGGIVQPKASGPLTRLVDAWLVDRPTTHRSANQDRLRWKKHLQPVIGKYAPDDVDVGMLKKLVTAKLAVGMSPATVRLLIRLVSTAFARTELEYGSSGWASILSWLAVLTMTIGNLGALRQDNVKRMLAYSSIAHAGYLLVGVVAIAVVGIEARGPLIYYLVAYTFTTVGAFGVVAWIGSRNDERLMVDDWSGLGSRHPGVALAMTIFMLSLGGIPPTAGFFGKFYVFRAALEKPTLVWLVIIAVLNSVISVFYYLRVVTAMYFREVGREAKPLRATSVTAALIIAAVGVLVIGILPTWFVDVANAAGFAQ